MSDVHCNRAAMLMLTSSSTYTYMQQLFLLSCVFCPRPCVVARSLCTYDELAGCAGSAHYKRDRKITSLVKFLELRLHDV